MFIYLIKLIKYLIFYLYFLGVWTSDAMKAAAVLEIGQKLKERLRIPQKMSIGYQVHKDTIDKTGSMTKNSYTI